MYPLYFSALLKGAGGVVIESGEACLSEQENSVIFNSDFVPLMKLGVCAQIVRIIDGQEDELECFSGKVYLSSRKLLQLTDIDPEVMQKARDIFSVNENAPISLMVAPGNSPHFNPQKADRISGHLRYISEDCLKLMAMEPIQEGKILAFSVELPELILVDLKVQVMQRIPLKKNTAVLRCQVLAPSAENSKALRDYIQRDDPSLYL